MADARALLRAERANRRITHPHASYKSDGKLVCNLCETLVKSEAQWQSHLHSSQHVLRSQRAQEADESRGIRKSLKRKASENEDEDTNGDSTAKTWKRKADGDESPVVERREKKVKKVAFADEDAVLDGPEMAEDVQSEPPSIEAAAQATQPSPLEPPATVDEAEYAAFERDLLALEDEQQQSTRRTALSAHATISAPAMSAQELAAQAREEQSAQRGKRDAELEEEREDAARVLEDEFEEMEGLEERVRKLKERREALRIADKDEGLVNGDTEPGGNEDNGEDEDDEDEDDYDDWNFGGR